MSGFEGNNKDKAKKKMVVSASASTNARFLHAPNTIAPTKEGAGASNNDLEHFKKVEILAHFLPYKIAKFFYPNLDGSRELFEEDLDTSELLDDDDQSAVMINYAKPLILKLKNDKRFEYYKVTLIKENSMENTGLMPFFLTPLKPEDFDKHAWLTVHEVEPKPNAVCGGYHFLHHKEIEKETLTKEIAEYEHNKVHVLFRGTSDISGWSRNLLEKNAGNDTLFAASEQIGKKLVTVCNDVSGNVDLSISGHSLGGADAQNFFTALLLKMKTEHETSSSSSGKTQLHEMVSSITLNHVNTAPVTENTQKMCDEAAKYFVKNINKSIVVNIIYSDGDVVQSLGRNVFPTVIGNDLLQIKMLKASRLKSTTDKIADSMLATPVLFALPPIMSVPILGVSTVIKGRRALDAHTRYIDPDSQTLEFYDGTNNSKMIENELSIRSHPVRLSQYIKNSVINYVYGNEAVGDSTDVLGLEFFAQVNDETRKTMLTKLSSRLKVASDNTIETYAPLILASTIGNERVARILLNDDKHHESLINIILKLDILGNEDSFENLLPYFEFDGKGNRYTDSDSCKEKFISSVLVKAIEMSNPDTKDWFDSNILSQKVNGSNVAAILASTKAGEIALYKITESVKKQLPSVKIVLKPETNLFGTTPAPITFSLNHFSRGDDAKAYVKKNSNEFNQLYQVVTSGNEDEVKLLLERDDENKSFYDCTSYPTDTILIQAARLHQFKIFNLIMKAYDEQESRKHSTFVKGIRQANPAKQGTAFNFLVSELNDPLIINDVCESIGLFMTSILKNNPPGPLAYMSGGSVLHMIGAKDSSGYTPIERIAMSGQTQVLNKLNDYDNFLLVFGVTTEEKIKEILELTKKYKYNDKFVQLFCEIANKQLSLNLNPNDYKPLSNSLRFKSL